MKILFLSDNFPPEGNAPATRLWEHAIRWVHAGHEVTVITCAPNFPEGQLFEGYRNRWRQVERLEGIRVVRVKSYITANEGFLKRTLDYVSFMIMSFVMGLFERRPDVVVATSPQFFCAIAGWTLSVAKWRPFVFELRDLWPASIRAVGALQESRLLRALEAVELFLYRRAALIISVTESFKRDLVARGVDGAKVKVVRNGVDLNAYSPIPKDDQLLEEFEIRGKFVVGYLGTHGLAHALRRVLEAAELLKDQGHIAFFFAGAGAERSNVERIVREKKLHNVRLIPRQPKERMPALWSLCDATLVPLRDDPVFSTVIPSKIFEAMAMGVPIIMSLPEGEATGIIHETGSGVCVNPERPHELSEVIVRMASGEIDCHNLSMAGQRAAKNFSRDEAASRMLSAMERIADSSMERT